MKRRFWWAVFLLYCAVMLWLLYGQRMGALADASINLRPFETICRFLWVLRYSNQHGMITHAVINLVGNVVMFVPLGLLLPTIWRRMRHFWACFVFAGGVILLVELTQFITRLGACDVDDLLLNMVGILCGYVLWRIFCGKM